MTEHPRSGSKATHGQPSDCFFFERKGCDLPYYRGYPIVISPTGWLAILVSVAVSFAVLIFAQYHFNTGFEAFIPALLFVAIPLATMALVAGRRAPLALFRSLRPVDWLLIIAFFVLNWIVTIIVGLIAIQLFDAVANPAGDRVANASVLDQVLFFGWTAIQLLGEEVFTILPFLAFLTFLDRRMPRKTALSLAALGASVIFALIHLPTYQWNVPQTLIGLVPVRIILLLPFIITRNIWVSAGTHILNDWAIFGLAIAGGGGDGAI